MQLRPGQLAGNSVAIVSGLAFALCIMGLRAVREEGPAVLAAGNCLAALAVLPLVFSGPAPTLVDGGMVLFLGVFQLALAYPSPAARRIWATASRVTPSFASRS